MHNPRVELAKKSIELAKKKYPGGFNKSDIIACSKEVNGGFSTNPLKPIKTMKDIADMGNHMSDIDGGYPRGMDSCFVVGINGGCGIECPVFLEGDCGEPQEFDTEFLIEEMGEEGAHEAMYKYDCYGKYSEEFGGK